jgi:hypothetical protein
MKRKKLDLTNLTGKGTKATVYIQDKGKQEKWIEVTNVYLTKRNSLRFPDVYTLHAYVSNNVTDVEHDTPCAFQIPLIGLRLSGIIAGSVTIEAFIEPLNYGQAFENDDFRVPKKGWDQMKEAIPCSWENCKGKHLVVPEGYYIPPHNRELHQEFSGRKITIHIEGR